MTLELATWKRGRVYEDETAADPVVFADVPHDVLRPDPLPEHMIFGALKPLVEYRIEGMVRSWLLDDEEQCSVVSVNNLNRYVVLDSNSTLLCHIAADAAAPLLRRVHQITGVDPAARSHAEMLVRHMAERDCSPDEINASVDGSVMAYLYGNARMPDGARRKYAVFECGEGGVAVLLKDRATGHVVTEDLDTADALDRAIVKACEFIQD